MNKKVILNKIQWLIQFLYISTCIILSFGIVGNMELNVSTPKHIYIIWIISTILTYSKIRRIK